MNTSLSNGISGSSSVLSEDLEQPGQLGLVEDDPLLGEEEPDLLRILGLDVGELHREVGIDERERPEGRDERVRRFGLEPRESLGVLLGEHRLSGKRSSGGLCREDLPDVGERDRVRHHASVWGGAGRRWTGLAINCFIFPPSRNEIRYARPTFASTMQT